MKNKILKPGLWLALLLLFSGNVFSDECSDFLKFSNNPKKMKLVFAASPEAQAWRWFVCLNQANSSDSSARVWESFKPTSEVYLPNGAKPSAFGTRASLPESVKAKATQAGMDLSKPFHNLDANVQVDGLVATDVFSQNIRYQLLMSEDTFDYIVNKGVYNVNGQSALTSDLSFPVSSWELKTSWYWIGIDSARKNALTNDGYYIVNAWYLDEQGKYQVGYAALSGMHIINRLFENWVWITFENINNPNYTVTAGLPNKSISNETGPTELAEKQNSVFQDQYAFLKNYELIGVQYRFGKEPELLASSQMETAFQTRSSCIACHSTAAYSQEDGYFNFAIKENDGIQYPLQQLPDADFEGYNKLDFVWSLKRAQWQRNGG